MKNTRTVTAPVARQRVIRTTEPRFHQSPPGTMVVSKCEYIGEVPANAGSPYGVVAEFAINPGNPALCPWASGIAGLFESYKFKKLEFHYEPESPTSDTGFVGLVIDYNPKDPPPTTKVVAMDFEESKRGPTWTAFSHSCSQKNLNKRKSYFCRRNDESDDVDPLLTDVGNLYVIAGGNTGTAARGELWVDYVIEFSTPELDSGASTLDGQVYTKSSSFNELDNQSGLAARVINPLNGINIFSNGRYDAAVSPVSGSEYREEADVVSVPKAVLEDLTIPTNLKEDSFVQTATDDADQQVDITSVVGAKAVLGSFKLTANRTYFANVVFDIVDGAADFTGLTLTANISSTGTVVQLGQVTNTSAGFIQILKITTGPLIRNPYVWFTFSGTLALGAFFEWRPAVYIRQLLPQLDPGALVPTLSQPFHHLSRREPMCHFDLRDCKQVLLSTPGREPTNRSISTDPPQQNAPDYVHLRRAYEEMKKEDFRDFARIAKG